MAQMTLSDAISAYLESIKGPSRQGALSELNRFKTWFNKPDSLVTALKPHDVATYGEGMGPANPETTRRAEHIRGFLVYLKKQGITQTNLATHLRLRKASRAPGAQHAEAPPSVELTADGITALKSELEDLMAQRIAVRKEIQKAMLDKDFRENAPLDAAKDKQGHIEARIREIESMLKRAVIVDSSAQTGRVRVGAVVQVKDAASGRIVRYSIVGPTEANAAEGKISSASPVGKALLDRTPGDEVEVSVPAGTMRLIIESVDA
jgi:transcription elongation factor GreA